MKCRLVFDDWRRIGEAESVYATPLGIELSVGDLHSGTTFEAEVVLPQDIEEEIKASWNRHGAYPALCLMPEDGKAE